MELRFSVEGRRDARKNSRLIEIAGVLVRLNHIARFMVNAKLPSA
jgi:hypothetical protein